jgi:hypothetical protein
MVNRRYEPPVRETPVDDDGQASRAWIAHHQDVSAALSGLVANVGVVDGTDATAGQVGEFLRAVSGAPGPILPHNVATNVLSLSLTAGDWQAWGEVWVDTTATAANLVGGISLVSAGLPALPAYAAQTRQGWAHTVGSHNLPLVPVRLSLSAPGTVYLVGYAFYTSGTGTVYGRLEARRVR